MVCPHCGARDRDRDPIERPKRAPYRDAEEPRDDAPAAKKEKMKISPEEAAALFATTATPATPLGPVALLVPRHGASPFARSLECLLTLVALPMLLLGLAPLVMRRRHRAAVRHGGEVGLSVAALGIGGLTFYALLHSAGWSQTGIWSVIGLSGGAIIARLVIRMRMT